MANDHYGVLIEHMNDKIDTLIEIVVPMKEKVDRIPKIEQDVKDIKGDISAIKYSIKQINRQAGDHDLRLDRLEKVAQ